LHDDASGGGPQVAFVFFAELLACDRMGLTGDPAICEIHAATEASARDGSGIRPDRRRSHSTLLNRFDQVSDGEGFPLHVQDRASAWDRQLDAEIKSASSGAEGDAVEAFGT
jgi:hypothetical protein